MSEEELINIRIIIEVLDRYSKREKKEGIRLEYPQAYKKAIFKLLDLYIKEKAKNEELEKKYNDFKRIIRGEQKR